MRWTKQHVLALAGAVVLLLLWGLKLGIHPEEPRYEGKPLRYWVHRAINSPDPERDPEICTALRAMGSDATPWLLRWLEVPETPVLDRVIDGISRQHFGGRTSPVIASGNVWNACGLVGFLIIGERATNAVPELLSRLHDSRTEVRRWAALILGRYPSYHEAIVPALISATVDPDLGVVSAALSALQRFGTNAHSALPAISVVTNHSDRSLRRFALRVLSRLSTNDPPSHATPPYPTSVK